MTSTCGKLDQYIDGSIDRSDAELFEQHLASCEACRFELDLESRLNSKIGDAFRSIEYQPDHPVEPVKEKRTGPWLLWAAAASILLAIGLGSWFLSSQAIEPQPKIAQDALPNESDSSNDQIATEEMVSFHSNDQQTSSILVKEPLSNKNFTIVRAYSPLVRVQKHDSP